MQPSQVLTRSAAGREVRTAWWGPQSAAPAVVLVHGIGVSHRYFGPLARTLAADTPVLAPDLPGFGCSPRSGRPPSVAEHAEVLGDLLGQLLDDGAPPPVLLGHSMGAQVVVETAVQRPDLARGVVVLGPVADPAARSALRQGVRLLRDVRHESVPANLLMVRDWLRCGPRWYGATVPEMLGYRLEEHLGAMRAPVVLVRGEHDPVTPTSYLERLAEVARSAQVVQVPGEGHIAMYRRPGVVAGVLRGLL